LNKLSGIIKTINSHQGVSLVDVEVANDSLAVLLLDTPLTASYLSLRNKVSLLFKESEVAISIKEPENLSIRNRLPCCIESLNNGKVITTLTLKYHETSLYALITARSAELLNLKVGDTVFALIKSTEISLAEEGF
jgi:molybdate transport system regulatory protein